MTNHRESMSPGAPDEWLLKIRRGGEAAVEIYLESVSTIGRSADNSIPLGHEPAADRVHARVTVTHSGAVWLRCEPGNSVNVGEEAIAELRLQPGVRFGIGGTDFECVRAPNSRPGGGAPGIRADDLAALADELLVLFQETSKYHHRHADIASVLVSAASGVRRLRNRLQSPGGSYRVALVGGSDDQKSHVLNALLGESLMPDSATRPRVAPVEFRHANGYAVKLHAPSTISPRPVPCDGASEVRSKIAEWFGERATGRIEVTAPMPLLGGGLQLVDLPAVRSPADPGVFGEAELAGFIRQTGSHVAWVVCQRGHSASAATRFYSDVLLQVCDDLVAVGDGDWPKEDVGSFRRAFEPIFALQLPPFHFVSSRTGSPRIDGFRDRLAAASDASRRIGLIADGLRELASDLGGWLANWRDGSGRPLDNRWRPDSWLRWHAALPGLDIKARLTQQLEDH